MIESKEKEVKEFMDRFCKLFKNRDLYELGSDIRDQKVSITGDDIVIDLDYDSESKHLEIFTVGIQSEDDLKEFNINDFNHEQQKVIEGVFDRR